VPKVRSSLRTIGVDLPMNSAAAPGLETIFGIDRLARGLRLEARSMLRP
jgi:hypothetical protein